MLQKTTLALFLLLVGCSESPPQGLRSFSGIAMTIPYEIKADAEKDPAIMMRIIQETFAEVDAHYNKFNPDSELSHFNRLKSYEKMKISAGMQDLLNKTDKLYLLSQGLFDPTVETIAPLWKEAIHQGAIPSQEAIELKRKAVGWNKVHREEGMIWKEQDETALDLGGIAKGYTVDLLYERLSALPLQHLYVEWGGEIRTSKTHPEGRAWLVAVHSPDLPHILITLELQDEAVATSGDYAQSYSLRDESGTLRNYFHVIDPRTLLLMENRSGTPLHVSVKADTCTEADGLATCLLIQRALSHQ